MAILSSPEATLQIRIEDLENHADGVYVDDLSYKLLANDPASGNPNPPVSQQPLTAINYYDYYPFGMKLTQSGANYRFGYQGDFSEEDQKTGFNHFEARDYDPVIGRWMSVDPAREFYSPYVAYANNPLMFVDPDGRDTWYVFNSFGLAGGAFIEAGEQIKGIYVWDDYGIVKGSSYTHIVTHDEGNQFIVGGQVGGDVGFGVLDNSSYLSTLDYSTGSFSAKVIGGATVGLHYDDNEFFAKGMEFSIGYGFGGAMSYLKDDISTMVAFTQNEVWRSNNYQDVVGSFNPYDVGVEHTDHGDFFKFKMYENSKWNTTDIPAYRYAGEVWETEGYKQRRTGD